MAKAMSRADLGRMGGAALMWGTSFLFIKVANEGVSGLQMVFARTVIGAATLYVFMRASRAVAPRGRVWGHLLFNGAFGNVAPFFLFAWAENGGVPSGLAGIYNATTPLWTMLIALAVLAEERATASRVAGLVIGFAGV